jgi:hypothetical protein
MFAQVDKSGLEKSVLKTKLLSLLLKLFYHIFL